MLVDGVVESENGHMSSECGESGRNEWRHGCDEDLEQCRVRRREHREMHQPGVLRCKGQVHGI